jgi:hypothetical protein
MLRDYFLSPALRLNQMPSAPSLIQEIRRILEEEGLDGDEIDFIIGLLIRWDASGDSPFESQELASLRTALESHAPEFARYVQLRRDKKAANARPNSPNLQRSHNPTDVHKPNRYVDVLIGVAGNAIFMALFETLKYLWQNGWVLHSPGMHLSHLYTILEMPYDENFHTRLPPPRARRLITAPLGFINVFREEGRYTALIIEGGLTESAARRVAEISDESLDALLESTRERANELNLCDLPIYYLGMARNFTAPWWGGREER